ncbi:hypothetical protein MIR68_002306 [Amoeboaphelidium protococcarum]|nr:hypothetical protein MIR68_002306 [Amoeboaphelidium protococcarum]
MLLGGGLDIRCSSLAGGHAVSRSLHVKRSVYCPVLFCLSIYCGPLKFGLVVASLVHVVVCVGSRSKFNSMFAVHVFALASNSGNRLLHKVVQHRLLLNSWLKFSHTGGLRPLVDVLVDGACAGSIALVCTKAAAEVMLAFLLNRSYQLG